MDFTVIAALLVWQVETVPALAGISVVVLFTFAVTYFGKLFKVKKRSRAYKDPPPPAACV